MLHHEAPDPKEAKLLLPLVYGRVMSSGARRCLENAILSGPSSNNINPSRNTYRSSSPICRATVGASIRPSLIGSTLDELSQKLARGEIGEKFTALKFLEVGLFKEFSGFQGVVLDGRQKVCTLDVVERNCLGLTS